MNDLGIECWQDFIADSRERVRQILISPMEGRAEGLVEEASRVLSYPEFYDYIGLAWPETLMRLADLSLRINGV